MAALLLFLVVLTLTTLFLWNAQRLAPLPLAGAALGIVALLWGVGALCEGRGARHQDSAAPRSAA